MNAIIFLVVCILSFNFGNGLKVYFDLHETGVFPKVVQILIECEEISKAEPHRNTTAQDIELRDNIVRRKKPIIQNYANLFITEVKVNATGRYRCTLATPVPHIYHDEVKTRLKRKLQASIPAEFGACKPGYSLASYDRCFPCHPGTYSSGQSSQCTKCPKNFYAPLPAQDSCYACPKGSKTISEGADNENDCIYFDDKGMPLPFVSTQVIVIIVCVVIFLVTVTIAFFVWHFWLRKRTRARTGQRKPGGKKDPSKYRPEIIRTDQVPLYGRSSKSEENLYAEIESNEEYDSDEYLVPKRGKDTTYAEIIDDPDSHIYEEPININSALQSKEPMLPPYAHTKVHAEKQKRDNSRFDPKRELTNDKKPLKKVGKERKDELKEKHIHEDELKNHEDFHNPEAVYYSSSSKSKKYVPTSRNSVSRSSVEAIAKILVQHQIVQPSNEAESENMARVLMNALKDPQLVQKFEEALIDEESMESASRAASDENLLEIYFEPTSASTSQENTPDSNEGNYEKQGKSSQSSLEIDINILDIPLLPEVMDSKIFEADMIN